PRPAPMRATAHRQPPARLPEHPIVASVAYSPRKRCTSSMPLAANRLRAGRAVLSDDALDALARVRLLIVVAPTMQWHGARRRSRRSGRHIGSVALLPKRKHELPDERLRHHGPGRPKAFGPVQSRHVERAE